MSSEVASESTWKPLPGSNRVLSRSSSDEELHQSLLDASDGSEQPRRRSSIQGQHMPQIRVPMRARLEQVWPKLRLLNKLLLPIGALLAAAGGGCAWALNGCRGIDSWLLESGGVIVGLPLLLDIFYLAALAPYAIFMSQANRDPLSCGPRRFVFPNDSAVPAVCSVGGLLSATVLSFGLACPLVSDQVCGERLTPWLRWLGALGTSACAYVLICLLYGDKGAIATLWVISVIMGSVGGACLDNTLAGVVDCHNALGWSLASIGFTLAYAIPLVLLSLWSRKCWPFVLSAGFLVFGIVVGATGAACVGDLLVGVAACDPAAGWALAAAGAATGGLPLLVVIVGIFYQTPYLIGEHGAVISRHQWPLNTHWLGGVGVLTFTSVITGSVSAMCWRQTIFAESYCRDGEDGSEGDGSMVTPAFWGMWVCFPIFLVTILIDCCVCWKGWMNKSTVDSWVH